MTIQGMHYDFKQKLNRLDSQKWRDLVVPEIDWKLREAERALIRSVAEPRYAEEIGFEVGQRTIDDIRSIVINQSMSDNNCLIATPFDSSSFKVELPPDYFHYVSSTVVASKGKCLNKMLSDVKVRKHTEEHELSPFDKSSFLWRRVNIRFIKEGIRIFTDGTFTVNALCLEYIKIPRIMHNAADFEGGTYDLDGVTLTGRVDCELPVSCHDDVVDLAVLLTAGDLGLPTYALKKNKQTLKK